MVAKQLRLFNGNTGRNFAKEYNFSEKYRGEGNPKWKPKIPKACLICGKAFSVVPSKADKAKYCSRVCRDTANGINSSWQNNPKCKGKVRKICEICGKEFWVWPCMGDTAKFCSHSCRGKAGTRGLSPEELRERNRRAMRILWDTPELRAKVMGTFQSTEHKAKLSQARIRFLLEHPEKHPNSIMAKRQYKGKGGISKGQFDLFEKIKAIFNDAELNYPIKANGHIYFVDVGVPSFQIGYEYDGQYWHQNDEEGKNREKNLKKVGWKLIRISGR